MLKNTQKNQRFFGQDKAYYKYPNATVLFVAHRGISRALISVILKRPAKYMEEIEKPLNASVYVFEVREDKKHVVHLMNCAKHLK